MQDFSPEEFGFIGAYFRSPDYPQPHAEIVTVKLFSAMISTGKYELKDYPMLLEAAIKLTKILAVRFEREARQIETYADPKLEGDAVVNGDIFDATLNPDYDPIPF